MRPCLGVVILVGAVEVPGDYDRLVCGHAEGGGGVERVTGVMLPGENEVIDGDRLEGVPGKNEEGGGGSNGKGGSKTDEMLCSFGIKYNYKRYIITVRHFTKNKSNYYFIIALKQLFQHLKAFL